MTLIDVSHAVTDGMVTYPGLPAPEIGEHLTHEQAEEAYAPGVTFQIGRICMVASTGTYVDSPYHRFADGVDLAALDLERLAGRPPQYGEVHPFLARAAAELLVDSGPGLVGIDSLNIDDTDDPQRPVHT